jgi:hypothetical protein
MAFGRAASPSMAGRVFGSAPGAHLALLRAAWPVVVGRETARRTEVVSVDRRTLNVRVADLGWQRVLHRMQRQILTGLAAVAGDLAPARLGFTIGAVSEERAGDPLPIPPAGHVAEPPPAVARAAEAIEDLELRRRFLHSAALYLERKHA